MTKTCLKIKVVVLIPSIHMHLSIYNQTLQKLQSIEILISTAYLNDRNYGEEENTLRARK